MSRSRIIQKRTRIFLGCEGESEQSYGKFVNTLADLEGFHVHIVAVNLQPAGNPFLLAQKAKCAYEKEKSNGGFAAKAIMLDTDKIAELPDLGQRATELLTRERFISIWQEPNHEGFLLRHFPGQADKSPSKDRAIESLRAQWPGYHKNMAAVDLQKKLTLQHVWRAADIIPRLKDFLETIGFTHT